jgi:hypothetical protein
MNVDALQLPDQVKAHLKSLGYNTSTLLRKRQSTGVYSKEKMLF